jgi:hypothetical protein
MICQSCGSFTNTDGKKVWCTKPECSEWMPAPIPLRDGEAEWERAQLMAMEDRYGAQNP